MDQKTVRALAAINQAFYRDSAAGFSETRREAWPGWLPLQRRLAKPGDGGALRVLDVGCGNGRFGAFLVDALPERAAAAHYCGLDTSEALLDAARARRLAFATTELWQGDATELAHDTRLRDRSFSLIAVFGLLHHLPGEARRAALLAELARRLEPAGLLALAFWRFDDFPRFRRRCRSFEEWNRDAPEPLDLRQLEPGDRLLRWGDGDAVRYCHHFDEAESERLLAATGLETLERYDADGREGNLNRYVLLGARGEA